MNPGMDDAPQQRDNAVAHDLKHRPSGRSAENPVPEDEHGKGRDGGLLAEHPGGRARERRDVLPALPKEKGRDDEEHHEEILAAADPGDQAGHIAIAREEKTREESRARAAQSGDEPDEKDDRAHERREVQKMPQRSIPGIEECQDLEIDAQRDRPVEGGLGFGKKMGPETAVILKRQEIEVVPEVSEIDARKVEHEHDEDGQEDDPAMGGTGFGRLRDTRSRTPFAVPGHGAAV